MHLRDLALIATIALAPARLALDSAFVQPDEETIASYCIRGACSDLIVRGGEVFFRDKGCFASDRRVGPYLGQYQRQVTPAELPILERHYSSFQIVVTAALLWNSPCYGSIMRLWFFSNGVAQMGPVDYDLSLGLDLGAPFGGDDVIAMATSRGSHAYGDVTLIWLLSEHQPPKKLLEIPAILKRL